ncbi:hypothetical protein J2S43_000932 [Catenuloplanes nepalensis]|uniref:RHIM domain-containing protein n=1 Tax=Catenuloplanes nepalensis TaxID=587533 RepID=A0ABT9MLW9_9ACTN|nr:hypothetical protein [Catenuloplanes nepalensis]MDP9792420.1 hypothetical protein [Catenuloplanes nepalensis]
MSAIELITAALAAGAGAGLQGTASTAVHDAYERLKAMLRSGLSGHESAVRALESDDSDAEAWQARIGEALIESGVAGDERVLLAAGHMLTLVGRQAKSFDIDVSTNKGAIGDFSGPVTFNQAPVPPAEPETR